MKEAPTIIETTTNDSNVAKKIINTVLEAKRAACAQVFPIESHYWWNGKIIEDKELIIRFKTTKSKTNELITIIKALHNYSLPEIIQINIDETSAEYLSWLTKETKNFVAH